MYHTLAVLGLVLLMVAGVITCYICTSDTNNNCRDSFIAEGHIVLRNCRSCVKRQDGRRYVRDCDVTYTLNGCLKNTDLQQSACYCDTDHCNGAISWAHVTGNHVIILVVTTVMTFFGL
ncbi:uncharacterized protein LOC127882232 [Dreissena polymorpha]|uniref:uncharacterized protein LOC127882232 n=1 Tax=Dreissena polymorpha TaxID=45954 RepID=UPI002264B052|nr:uncharacterized protein LOC127882232 [Dreissena polymorpha]